MKEPYQRLFVRNMRNIFENIICKMTLKKAYDDGLTEFNQCLLSMEQIKHTILNTM